MKLLGKIVIAAVLLAGVGWAALWYRDYRTVAEVREVVTFLQTHYRANGRYPAREVFYQNFSRQSRNGEEKYLYSFDPATPQRFWLQYPMNGKRSFAIGERRISEFTGTTYAYVITPCDIGGECSSR